MMYMCVAAAFRVSAAVSLPPATYDSVHYGPHERQVVDVWLPKDATRPTPAVINIHGGGFTYGDRKEKILAKYIPESHAAGVAVVSVEYRLVRHSGDVKPPVRVCMDDIMAAVRFVRSKAKEWNIDLNRMALSGGSAGGCAALHVALSNDNALGIKAVYADAPQTTLDPKVMRAWMSNARYGHKLFGFKDFQTWHDGCEESREWIEKYSAMPLLEKCSEERIPSVIYSGPKAPKAGMLPKDPTHSGIFTERLEAAASARGAECRRGSYKDMLNVLVSTGCNRIVRSVCVGDVRIDCPKPGDWRFLVTKERKDGVDEIMIRLVSPDQAVPPRFDVSFDFPQIGMDYVWSNGPRELGPDWGGGWNGSGATRGQPVTALHDCENRNRFTMACSETHNYVERRVSLREENCHISGGWRFFKRKEASRREYQVRLRFDRRDIFWSDAVQEASAWVARTAGLTPCIPPESAYDPLYSTWYAFHQNVFAKDIEEECRLAVKAGMKTIILDDGWQTDDNNRGYAFSGDWEVSRNRFPDMAAHVKTVQAMGMKYMVWYAVPFVGKKSVNYARFKGKYLSSRSSASILDPRFPEDRRFIVDTYVKALKEWNIDGFKLDFIDSFGFGDEDPAVKANYAGRDIRSLPDAVDRLMRDVHDALVAVKPDILIEFRQGYVGPVMRQYGNMLRAGDCPGNMLANRKRITELRLLSGPTAVHADMLEWHPSDTPVAAARPIIWALFGVVQYSMRLKCLPKSHLDVIRHWLAFSQEHREALLRGSFKAYHPQSNYPVLEGESEAEKVLAVYLSDAIAPCGRITKPTFVINGTGADSLVLEIEGGAMAESFDTFGKSTGCKQIDGGVMRVKVPPSGYVKLIRHE